MTGPSRLEFTVTAKSADHYFYELTNRYLTTDRLVEKYKAYFAN
ncbi:hypothetical protein NVIE_023370 [Nitrososphaera viennensis EN76]|uniref:Uncharacterized protein n=1 Tax=Nitrososphaera viennensis EN76 TaxID=926571 RepID=A0A060HSY7_9ARCH|nr:hypothetical protein NVIE_023370 [Nitrososphaera viennensis EN76]